LRQNPTPLARDPPPRSPATDVSIRRELCSSGAVASHRPGRARPAFRSGREMTQGAMPSDDPLRVPLAGASPLSRRGRKRLVARRLGGGKEPGELLLRAAWAELRRVKGTGPVWTSACRAPGCSVLPSSMRGLEHPNVAAAGVYRWSGGPGPPSASAKVACVSGPPRRDPAAGQPGCLGRFVSTRPGWDCSRLPGSPDLRSRRARC